MTESTTKCPSCGAPMKRREGKRGAFLGCTAWPTCTGTRPIAATVPPPAQPSLLPPPSSSPSSTGTSAGELVVAIKKLTDVVEALTAQLAARPITPDDDDF